MLYAESYLYGSLVGMVAIAGFYPMNVGEFVLVGFFLFAFAAGFYLGFRKGSYEKRLKDIARAKHEHTKRPRNP